MITDKPADGRTLAALVVLWALVQAVFLLAYGGVHGAGDSGRYLGAAGALLSGEALTGKAASYLGYDLFVAAVMAFGGGPVAVAAVQALLSLVAALALGRIGLLLFGGRAGIAAAAAFLLYPDIQRWNMYVLTESLFISAVVISVYLVLTASTRLRIAAAVLAVLFTAIVRPNGFIVAAAALLYAFWILWRRGRFKTLGVLVALVAVALPLAGGLIGTMSGKEHMLDHYREGTVVWGYPQGGLGASAEADSCDDAGGSLAQLACYAGRHPGRFMALALAKIGQFLLHARPFYSDAHNAFSLVTLLPAYALAVLGMFRAASRGSGWLLPALVVVFQAGVVGLSFADWDGRHLDAILPLVFLFACGGLFALVPRKQEPARTG
jgi:hypothetical protein